MTTDTRTMRDQILHVLEHEPIGWYDALDFALLLQHYETRWAEDPKLFHDLDYTATVFDAITDTLRDMMDDEPDLLVVGVVYGDDGVADGRVWRLA
ncbi:hypothetical protein [Rhodococcoides fascians]|uniref:hypothetical protein n=1 Tax=Rhodococcoides fascians TaxID=1828 RepID=UPI00055B3B9D|nr:hypothetical protein [Rhodococcus fascians]